MEPEIKKTAIKRILSFLFDFAFIALLSFSVYLFLGSFVSIESGVFKHLIYPFLIIILFYLFFGELVLKNTLGKYLFGLEITNADGQKNLAPGSLLKRGLMKFLFPLEGLVLLISKSGKRLGDLWSQTKVVKKEYNNMKPAFRVAIGIVTLIGFYFIFAVLLGFAVKKTDFYTAGADYLKVNKSAEITGLPTSVNLNGEKVDFSVPVYLQNKDKYAVIFLEKTDGKWHVSNTEFYNGHIGVSFGLNIP
jgi:uncharacterized RDD family membrane protein YckC